MKRGNAKLRRVFMMGSVCTVLVGTVGNVLADAPQAKAQKVATEPIGWGKPQDGLQIGLFPQSRQESFRYGATIALVLRAHNVGSTPIELMMRPAQIGFVTLGENGRLALQTLGSAGTAVPFRLAPGETAELPGGRFAAQIVAPGEKLEPGENTPTALALLPGKYHVECSYPIWMPDKNDANRATAHRAKPGLFAFTVREETSRRPVKGRTGTLPNASIFWGETVNGLQGGLQRVTEKDLPTLPAERRPELAANEVFTRFYVRNVTDKTLRLEYRQLDENDASFWVKDAHGKDQMVHSTFDTGLRVLSEHTLQPGEVMQAGEGRLKFQTQEVSQEQNISTPLLTAEPGQYTLRVVSSVRFARLNSFDMVLVSGALPFAVAP